MGPLRTPGLEAKGGSLGPTGVSAVGRLCVLRWSQAVPLPRFVTRVCVVLSQAQSSIKFIIITSTPPPLFLLLLPRISRPPPFVSLSCCRPKLCTTGEAYQPPEPPCILGFRLGGK